MSKIGGNALLYEGGMNALAGCNCSLANVYLRLKDLWPTYVLSGLTVPSW